MCLLILPPHSVQLSFQNSYEKHAYVYEACHTKCPLLPHKRQYILLYGVYKFPILYCVCVWEREMHSHMALHLWCMARLTILHLLCSTLRLTQAVQKSRLWQRGSLHIFLSVRLPLCIPPNASMKSVFIPPYKSISTSSSQGGGFGMTAHSWTFSPTTHVCTHSHQPADPSSCFIVHISQHKGWRGWRLLTGPGLLR